MKLLRVTLLVYLRVLTMTNTKKPDVSKAIITIKGYHFSNFTVLGAFGILFFSIAMLIIALKASKVFSARAMTIQ